MRILEKYNEKVKIINANGEIEIITIEEYNKIIELQRIKILSAKKWMNWAVEQEKKYILNEIKKLKETGQWEQYEQDFKFKK